MRTALIQFNPTIGDIARNAERMASLADQAREQGAELVVFPELAICGYPPRDLLLHEGFVTACARAAKHLGEHHSAGCTIIFGCPLAVDRDTPGTANSLLAYRDGVLIDYYDKRLLPTYDVFDEDRYFEPGDRAVVIEVPTSAGLRRVGLSICEDLWQGEDAGFASRYASDPDPVAELARAGADTIVSPSASPFVLGKGAKHRDILTTHATRHGVCIAAVNQVGGNDDLLFDGHAAAYDALGRALGFGPGFQETITIIDLPAPEAHGEQEPTTNAHDPHDPLLTTADAELLFRALVLGTRDYLGKTRHSKAIIGLSGGIDSAITCAVAAAALGAAHVLGVAMPGKYSSDHALADAYALADALGVRCVTTPIAEPFDGLRSTLDATFTELGERTLGKTLPDITEENLQSRARGAILMAISNRTGAIVLTTGNKSELAVGYCTLYGDMNGGLAVLSDVTKLQVYALARWLNAEHTRAGFATPPIPVSTIEKPPSAELAPGQLDQDSLPPYEVLDEVIERYIEHKQSVSRIVVETGYEAELVARIARLIDINEYKRKQTAVGIKVSSVAFGSGRRVPIAQRWRSE
ncbi:NAD synthetase / Glutamine amidotransferase chain of NAD synthetase [hydrothermal vent metagenome]|uniref:NAD(+) synthase (glutamine-hydrolyzing) n=1 Tax=hydrothermal vent metagenome TaxID=652676 RepID=A0A3B1DZI6_9ZZZZ